jgi:hypothetical protein
MKQTRSDNNLCGDIKAVKCRCGSPARVRYRIPVTWVECKNKCGIKTGFYPDVTEQADPESRNSAIRDWNMMISRFHDD